MKATGLVCINFPLAVLRRYLTSDIQIAEDKKCLCQLLAKLTFPNEIEETKLYRAYILVSNLSEVRKVYLYLFLLSVLQVCQSNVPLRIMRRTNSSLALDSASNIISPYFWTVLMNSSALSRNLTVRCTSSLVYRDLDDAALKDSK